MALIWDGYGNQEMAKILKISIRTVEVHRGMLYRKMKVKSTVHLIKKALLNKLITVPEKETSCR
jgi:DNA-binding CsgD family transcriptional regulator